MTVSQISPARRWLHALCLCLESFVRQGAGLLPQSRIAESAARTGLGTEIRLLRSASSLFRIRACGMKIGCQPLSPSFTHNPPSATDFMVQEHNFSNRPQNTLSQSGRIHAEPASSEDGLPDEPR